MATRPFFITQQNQSIFDLALMCYGDMTLAFQLISENTWLSSISDNIPAGSTIYYTPGFTNATTILGLSGKVVNTGDNFFTLPPSSTDYILMEDGTIMLSEQNNFLILE